MKFGQIKNGKVIKEYIYPNMPGGMKIVFDSQKRKPLEYFTGGMKREGNTVVQYSELKKVRFAQNPELFLKIFLEQYTGENGEIYSYIEG